MDTGPLVALGDAADHRHIAASELLRANAGSLVIPILVAAEVAYLLAKRLGVHAEAAFLSDIAQGAFKVEPVNHDDWSRILELVVQYRDFPLGTVDASILAVAERLNISTIATFDHRHFTVVRPTHVDAFELLP